jgi:hypothetical protein
MVGCGSDMLDSEFSIEYMVEFIDKFCSSVCCNFCWYPVVADDVPMEEVCDGLCVGFWKGLGFDPFGKEVHSHDYIVVA